MDNDKMMDPLTAGGLSTVLNPSQSCQICAEAVDDNGKDGLCEICRLLNEQLLLSATLLNDITTAPHNMGDDGKAKAPSRRAPGRQRGRSVNPNLSQAGIDRLFQVGFSPAAKPKPSSPQFQSQSLSGMNPQTLNLPFRPPMLVDPDVFNSWNSTPSETEPGPRQVGNDHESALDLQKPLEPSGVVGNVRIVDWTDTSFNGQYFDIDGTIITHMRNGTTDMVTRAMIIDSILRDVDRTGLRAELGMDLGVPQPKIDHTTYAWDHWNPPRDAYYEPPPQPPPPPSGY